jgi:hypothetical protein
VELELINGPKKPKAPYRCEHTYACAVHANDLELRRRLGRSWQGVLFA